MAEKGARIAEEMRLKGEEKDQARSMAEEEAHLAEELRLKAEEEEEEMEN